MYTVMSQQSSQGFVLYQITSSYRNDNGNYIIVAKLLNRLDKIFEISAVDLVKQRRDILASFSVDDIVSIVGIATCF